MSPVLLEERLCFAVYSASHAFTRAYRALLDPLGLTYPQYLVLLLLWERDRMRVKEIGARLYLDSGTLTPLLKRLEAGGYVRRVRDAGDERQVGIVLTAAGHELQGKASAIPQNLEGMIGLSNDEVTTLTGQVAGLRDGLREGTAPADGREKEGRMIQDTVTAAVLVIGDEILSGRTKDRNVGSIAERCTELGIDLREVRIVADEEDEIVAALDALRHRFTYVFTTGGIGPTHDDITADAVARAFGVAISEDERAIALLLQRIKPEDLNEARRRMARIPHGAALVENSVSKAPGFWIDNVIVMAGVPAVMAAMLDAVTPQLRIGARTLSEAIPAAGTPEGSYAAGLRAIAGAFPHLSIGSYPAFRDGSFHNEIVVRGKEAESVAEAAARVRVMLADLH